VQVEIAKGRQGESLPFLTSRTAVAPNTPTHIAATYDGTTMAIYIKGRLDVSQPAGGDITSTVGLSDLGIGNQVERDRAFNGIIDEMALYATALPADRIADHAAAAIGSS
jgi:hypothetical protein